MDQRATSMPSRRPWIFASAFVATLLFLAVRPYIHTAHTWFYGSDIGAWNMYKHRVLWRDRAALQSGEHKFLFPHRQYIWHNHFISTGHPHLSLSAVEAFAEFLSGREELWQLIPEKLREQPWQVVFTVSYRRDYDNAVHLSATRELSKP